MPAALWVELVGRGAQIASCVIVPALCPPPLGQGVLFLCKRLPEGLRCLDRRPELVGGRGEKRPHCINPVRQRGQEAGVGRIKSRAPARFREEGHLAEAGHPLLELGLAAAQLPFQPVTVSAEGCEALGVCVRAPGFPRPRPPGMLNGCRCGRPAAGPFSLPQEGRAGSCPGAPGRRGVPPRGTGQSSGVGSKPAEWRAPAFFRSLAALVWPARTALSSGVSPESVCAFTSASCLMKSRTQSGKCCAA